MVVSCLLRPSCCNCSHRSKTSSRTFNTVRDIRVMGASLIHPPSTLALKPVYCTVRIDPSTTIYKSLGKPTAAYARWFYPRRWTSKCIHGGSISRHGVRSVESHVWNRRYAMVRHFNVTPVRFRGRQRVETLHSILSSHTQVLVNEKL